MHIPEAEETDFQPATIQLYLDKKHPSHIKVNEIVR